MKSKNAMAILGAYFLKEIGVERNERKGARLMIDGGDISKLAVFYRSGIGVAVNKKKALELCHRSISQGKYVPATNFDLGEMCKAGEGTRVNYYKAIHHFYICLEYSKFGLTEKTHLELASIFESVKDSQIHIARAIIFVLRQISETFGMKKLT